jgi:hypothetical protein
MIDEIKWMKERVKKAQLILVYPIKEEGKRKKEWKHVFDLVQREVVLGTGIEPTGLDFAFNFNKKILFSDLHFVDVIKVHHAILKRNEKGSYSITELEGKVKVNGKKISKETPLLHKSKIQLGKVKELKIEIIYG